MIQSYEICYVLEMETKLENNMLFKVLFHHVHENVFLLSLKLSKCQIQFMHLNELYHLITLREITNDISNFSVSCERKEKVSNTAFS